MSLDSSLRLVALRNMESTALTTRDGFAVRSLFATKKAATFAAAALRHQPAKTH
jgi:hypothetical protein